MLAAALSLSFAVDARADTAEVGVDLANGRFSSLLPYYQDVNLSFDVDENSTVVTTFWRIEDGASCTPTQTKGATTLSSVRDGDPKGGRVKLLSHIGRLSVGFTYCFRFVVETRTPITAAQKIELSQDMFNAVVTYARKVAPSTPPAKTPTPPSGAEVLAQLDPSSSPLLLTPVIHNEHKYATLWEELKDRIPRDQRILDLLGTTFDAQATLKENETLSFYTDQIDKALGQAGSATAIAYEPIRNWQRVKDALAAKPEFSKALAAASTETDFLSWLSKACNEADATRQNCVEELTKSTKAKGHESRKVSLTDDEKDDLSHYFATNAIPFMLDVGKVRTLRGTLGQSGLPFKERKEAFDRFVKEAGLPSSVAGWPHADRTKDPAIDLALTLEYEKLLDHLVADESVTTLSGDAWDSFLADVQADTSRSVSATGTLIQGPPEEVFPAYIGLDIGVAGASFPDRTKAWGSIEPVQYFGLNFYLAAVDKDDPRG